MNNKTQITSAALLVAAATGFAAAGSLDLDRSYAAELKADAGARSVLNQGNLSNIAVTAGVRFGYDYNDVDGRATSDDNTTMGFGFKDAMVAVEGDVTDNMHARVSFDFGPDDAGGAGGSGAAALEDAFVDWAVNDTFSLRVGQFVPAGSAEGSTSEYKIMGAYRGVAHEFLDTPSWTQGIEAHFGGDTWGFALGFNDGRNAGNTSFNSGSEADFGINARFDFYSDSDKGRFDDQTSWRGSAAGWRLGAGLQWQSMGSTNPSGTDLDNLFFAVDGTYEADGWSATAAFYYTDIEDTATTDHNNMGFSLAGTFFFSDQWEGYGRWDMLILDDDTGAGQTTNEDTFNFIAVGANYYFVPESHAAKFTLELGISLDETADITNTSGDAGVGAFGSAAGTTLGSTGFFQENGNEDGQIRLSGVMQWMF
ncbi:MAG: porin [Phycisphaerales bacterium]